MRINNSKINQIQVKKRVNKMIVRIKSGKKNLCLLPSRTNQVDRAKN